MLLRLREVDVGGPDEPYGPVQRWLDASAGTGTSAAAALVATLARPRRATDDGSLPPLSLVILVHWPPFLLRRLRLQAHDHQKRVRKPREGDEAIPRGPAAVG